MSAAAAAASETHHAAADGSSNEDSMSAAASDTSETDHAAADGASSEESEWEILSDSLNRKRRVTEEMALKEYRKRSTRPRKLSVVDLPIDLWKAASDNLSKQFMDELNNAHRQYVTYVRLCNSRGRKPIPLSAHCFQTMHQTGWVARKGLFTLLQGTMPQSSAQS